MLANYQSISSLRAKKDRSQNDRSCIDWVSAAAWCLHEGIHNDTQKAEFRIAQSGTREIDE